jgi:hypothetical protein
MPRIGDMLIVKPEPRHTQCIVGADVREYIGIVYKIEYNKWGHQEKVHVQWSDDMPPSYNKQHGYAGTNIHNLRSEFQVIRDGIDIP